MITNIEPIKDFMGPIEKRGRELLDDHFPQWKTQPSSLSGRFHAGDTMGMHLEKAVCVMKHLCDCFAVPEEDRDLLVAGALLHDIGRFLITVDVEMMVRHWKWFPRTRHCRLEPLMKIHGPCGSAMLEDYKIPRKEELKPLIATHMGHWNPEAPQPVTLYQHLICIADYMSSRNEDIFTYVEEKKEEKAKEIKKDRKD